MKLQWPLLFGIWLGASGATSTVVSAEPAAEDFEFFEKRVRPLLVEVCQKCHGADKQEAGLRVDSREALLKGGDSGPAIEPGKVDESLLVEAIGYAGTTKMPPKAKLPDEQIADLTEWVKRGAPWPAEKSGSAKKEFNFAARKAEQWVFRPIAPQAPPEVADGQWPIAPIDHFILSTLQAAGLKPAPPADKRTLLRRVTYDLIGLPPTPAEIDAFLADESPQAFERVVDRLLDSPHYGERWARHWLDLVRFAETCGHEFDFDMPYAFEYRDYVIRAFNADLPYNRFVIEHLAGDLLPDPRRNPSEGFNESIIGTGFWFLGESKHSPVDVRADEAERLDNMIDVFGKTFLAQTLGCARCHDHKFDAISTKDYYALSGYLQSSRFQVACVDRPNERLGIVRQLEALEARRQKLVAEAASAAGPKETKLASYLLASLAVLRPEFDRSLVADAGATSDDADIVFEDFEKPTYGGWKATGDAFGDVPNRRPLPDYQGEVGAIGNGFVNSHSALAKKGRRTATDELTGTLTSPEFTISRPYVHFLIGGGAHAGKTCLNLRVGGKAVRTATGRNDNRMAWATFDVREYGGREATIEIVDRERGSWGNIGVDQIVFSRSPRPDVYDSRIAPAAKKYGVDQVALSKWVSYLRDAALSDAGDPFHLWAELASQPGELSADAFTRFKQVQQAALEARATTLPLPLGEGRGEGDASPGPHSSNAVVFDDFSQREYAGWFVTGEAFGGGPSTGPTVSRVDDPAVPVFMPRSGGIAHSGLLSNRLEGVLRSKTFTIEKNRILYRMAGKGTRVNLIIDSYQHLRNPIYGGLTIGLNQPDRLQWFAQDVSKWVGHNAYIELVDDGDGFLAVDAILFSDGAPPEAPASTLTGAILRERDVTAPESMARAYERVFERVAKPQASDERGAAQDRDTVRDKAQRECTYWLSTQDLAETLSPSLADSRTALRGTLAPLVRERRALEQQIHYRRKVMALVDGTPEDDRVHVRGSPHKFGDVVPRRLLEAIAGADQPAPPHGSGRLELARRMVDPADPVLPRVIVNRLWKHHFGEGLARTPDDFGNMGQPPAHPELLDYLAHELVNRRWSLKSLHRLMLVSRTYQMASRAADARAEEADPQNKLWHRMNLRRLEGEIIRDAMLAVSGRLDRRPGGPGVMPYLTPFMIGRGRPATSGPLDGDGRRSIYLNVRRNFLTPMFVAFDYPVPFSTIGRRSVSNVPAQALALMNNPFVLDQAEVWARRVMAEHANADERLRAMYLAAFARVPDSDELAAARAFLDEQSRQHGAAAPLRPWSDLAHVLFNVKEFVFVD